MDPSDIKPGQWVDGFRVIRRLGRGYFGLVFEVEKGGQRFALKFAGHREGSGDAALTDARIERELICLHQLRHPYIVRVWGAGHWPNPRTGYRYIVLDFIDGYTLGEWAERTHPTPHEVAVLVDKILDAMEHMHGRGIFHRDFNLQNVLVRKSDNAPVIIDFSVGDYAAAENLTNGGLPPGTPRYRSPEAAAFLEDNRHNPRARYTFKETDEIYALGAVVHDLLTHLKPSQAHKGEPLDSVLFPPLSPFEVTQGRVPQALSDFTMSLIARAPGERPACARDARRVSADLRKHEGTAWHMPFQPAAAQVPPAPRGPVRALAALARRVPRPSGHRGWAWAALGGGLALAALLAAMSTPLPPAPEEGGKPAALVAAKQTDSPGALPLSLPTQQETSPTVNTLKDASPPAPQPPRPRKASAPRTPSLAQCTLAIATAAWLKLGCAGVQLRPEPGPCTEPHQKGMNLIHWGRGPGTSAMEINIDVNQPRVRGIRSGPAAWGLYKDGPITGATLHQQGHAPPGTRLEGHLWTSGDRIYGRYLWADVPGFGRVPVCLELGEEDVLGEKGSKLGVKKQEGSKPGAALAEKRALATVVWADWR